jgi:N-acyl-L-homoserine lactone synthetase
MAEPQTADLTLHFDPRGALLQSTLDCEEEVFAERYSWPREDTRAYYAPYDASSTYVAVADPDGRVVAMARYIYPSNVGLATVNEMALEWHLDDGEELLARTGLDLSRTWDVGSVAVRKDARRYGVMHAAALYHGLLKASAANDVRGFVSLIDERVRRLLGMFGLIVHPIPGTTTAAYGGSKATTPVWANMATFVGDQRRNDPDSYRLVTLGVGLAGVRVPGPEAFKLRRPLVPAPVVLPQLARIDLTDARTGSEHRQVVQT